MNYSSFRLKVMCVFLFCLLLSSYVAVVHASTSVWNIATVSPANNSPLTDQNSFSLALDSQGKPHVAFCEQGRDSPFLVYASLTSTGWRNQTVDSVFLVAPVISLAIDSHDNPHIAYFASSTPGGSLLDLRYASWTGSGWNIETVEANSGTYPQSYQTSCSLALDSKDNPKIAYSVHINSNHSLKFASKISSVWTIQTLDQNYGQNQEFCSLAIDSHDNPWISYYVQNYESVRNESLKLITWNGSLWTNQTVDSPGGAYCAIALDSHDKPCISYYVYTAQDKQNRNAYGTLKFAKFDGATWAIQNVTQDGWANGVNSLAIDSNGVPYICFDYVYHYSTETNPSCDLDLASWTGSGWNTQTIFNSGTYPLGGCSLVIDSSNNPQICYIDNSLNFDYASTVLAPTSTPTTFSTSNPSLSPTPSLSSTSSTPPNSDTTPSSTIPEFPVQLIGIVLLVFMIIVALTVESKKRTGQSNHA